MTNRNFLAGIVALATFVIAGSAAGTEYPVTVTDIAGRQVTIAHEPKRIVLQDGREILTMALLDRDNPFARVVAWSNTFVRSEPGYMKLMTAQFGDAPQAKLLSLSDNSEIDIEGLLSRQPDLVVAQALVRKKFQEVGVEEKLAASGIPLIYLDEQMPPETTMRSIEILGQAINREKEADEYVGFYKSHYEHLKTVIAGISERPKVFMEAKAGDKGDECCYTHAHRGLGSLVETLGAQNIGSILLPGSTGNISIEALLSTEKPDVYVMTGSQWTKESLMPPFGYEVTPETVGKTLVKLEQRTGFTALKAYQDNRVYGLYHQFFNHAYNIIGLEYLATFIYPKEFADLDPSASYHQLISTFTRIPDAPIVLGLRAPRVE